MASKVVLSGILSGCAIGGMYAYLNSTQQRRKSPPNKCKVFLDQYVKCLTIHENQVPRPYELEWCTEEKDLYNDCMDDIRNSIKRNEKEVT